MHIHQDEQSRPVKSLDGGVHVLRVLFADRAARLIHDHLGLEAQPHVGQTHLPHHLGLRFGDIVLEVSRSLLPDKTEPLANVGAFGQAVQAAARDAGGNRGGG
jgi:hypothetical protein